MNPEDDRMTDALKDGIDRLMGEVEIPDGLVIRALRRRTERGKFRAVAGSTAAIVAVVGLFAATLAVAPPQLPTAGSKILTVAYVTGRIEQAMARASTDKRVEQVTIRAKDLGVSLIATRPGHRKATPPFAALTTSRLRFWFYRSQYRMQGLTSAGQPMWDNVIHTSVTGPHAGRESGYAINYQGKTWWRAQMRPQKPAKFVGACNSENFWLAPWAAIARDWTAIIRSALKCDTYKIVGYQRVDGQKTIKLAFVPGQYTSVPEVHQTLWVARPSYLPVRAAWTWQLSGQPKGHMVSDFVWSKPTKAALAPLHAAIPAGFRELKQTLTELLTSVIS